MNRLMLLRHAKAVPPDDSLADRDRPLADKGERAMADIGAWAAEHGFVPDLVLCSPSARTRQTLALILPPLEKPEVRFEEALYLAEASALIERLRRVAADRASVMVVGHNPGLHELAVTLMRSAAGAAGRRLRESMPTGALAVFELDGPWPALGRGSGRLAAFVTPKELRS